VLITRVNDLINENHCDEAVTYLNLTGHYLDTTGQVTSALQTDGVHLSVAGYEIVAAGIKPFIS